MLGDMFQLGCLEHVHRFVTAGDCCNMLSIWGGCELDDGILKVGKRLDARRGWEQIRYE